MSNSEPSWPKFLQRLSTSADRANNPSSYYYSSAAQPATNHQTPPPLPARPLNNQLYQPQQLWSEPHASGAPTAAIQELSTYMDEQQSAFDRAKIHHAQPNSSNSNPRRRNSLRLPVKQNTNLHNDSIGIADDKPPTTERVAEFRLDIPDGIRNMTQHPGDTIVGSVVVTVTKPTKALRITLRFLGQQRVHLRDKSSAQPSLSPYVTLDYTIFDKQLALWGKDVNQRKDPQDSSDAHLETLPPGTLRIPFSIVIPRINYPSTIKKDKICRVRYVLWAVFERPGTFIDHTMTTDKEEIYIDPITYPTRPKDVAPINETINPKNTEGSSASVAVQVTGVLSQLPAMPGDRLLYQLEAHTVAVLQPSPEQTQQSTYQSFIIKYVRIVFVEKLKLRGLIRGLEHTHSHRTDVHKVTLLPTANASANSTKPANTAATYSSSGTIKVPMDLCAFDSKLLRRSYELRIECDVVDTTSLLNKVTKQKSTYAMRLPIEVCAISPDTFDTATYRNAYTDESRNISGIAPPYHYMAAVEPEIRVGGWEMERNYQKWNKSNPCWIELANKRAAV
ncbi:hypothetical protein BX070DRAFT_234355 [Coemansia spiralis]|nr:hypothetical protein BX070DRAFT_234355 [Coemansia spiralis]